MAVSKTKRCSKCQRYKLRHLFYANTSSPDGLRPDCKYCHNKTMLTYWGRMGSEINARRREARAEV